MRRFVWFGTILHNLENVKNTHGRVYGTLLKVTLLHGCFSSLLNCINGTKLREVSLIVIVRTGFLKYPWMAVRGNPFLIDTDYQKETEKGSENFYLDQAAGQ